MAVELRNRSYGEYNERFGSREIFFDVYKDGVETVYIVVYDAGELLHLQDIWPTGEESDNILGVVGVRQLIRELKKVFPRATKISMIRYGGAKHQLEDPKPDTEEEYHAVEWKI